MKPIIIIKFGAIGDIIMTLPSYLALSEIYGNQNIIWFVGYKYKNFLNEILPNIKTITFNSDILFTNNYFKICIELIYVNFKILRINPSKVFLFHKSVFFLLLALSRFKVLHRYGKKTKGHSSNIPNRYLGYNYFEYVFGQDFSVINFDKFFSKTSILLKSIAKESSFSKNRYAVFCPGYSPSTGSNGLKRRMLSVDKWIEIANIYRNNQIKIYIIGSENEKMIFSNYFTLNENLCGSLTFKEIISVFINANCVISTDNGLLHLAYHVSRNVLAIMGPTPISTFLPPKFPKNNILQNNLPCVPCYDGKSTYKCNRNACILDINFLDKIRI
jgi:ADP-heptose:LPS heptosyltransferase